MRYLLPFALLTLATVISLSAVETVGANAEDEGFVNVDLLTLRSVLAGGVAVYESGDGYLRGESPITRLPDRSIATLLGWIRDEETGQVLAARVSVPQGPRFHRYVVACGDIARRETLRLRAPCGLAGPATTD